MSRRAVSMFAGALAWTVVTVVPAGAQQASGSHATSKAGQEAKSTTEKSGNAIKDSWITMKIHSQFIPEDSLEGSDINVDTNNGSVTLTGTVASEAGKTRAVAIAKATDGVKSVNDKLRVAPAAHGDADHDTRMGTAGHDAKETAKGTASGATKPVTDGWIKSKIYAQYVSENALDDSDINLNVNHGVVTLKGTVTSAEGKSRAEQIAKSTDGVKSVKNDLRVGRG